ncbi:low molecular weight phosphotyrosine protein phosphatase [Marinicella sp. S1101]|uniref:low molecular weight protein-tyrosine-phosphatase n=1 Tax=Marinicella marina TaxID=2996016 RepID=UPI002260B1F9|nr:low molecular weight protein-tyrosine-phosphatase [Marinicella marina]MCX7554106.1 low molecular weight phosphotyrosine protein phosphatase [Marinicella marina]MDJ1141201.1 low molecular weight protein-tyrosine-phosphatase [Marinicella marina]
MKKILFICMGNICRSPSAEAVFQQLVNEQGLAADFVIDSAGTHSYHVGAKPDPRSMQAAKKRGIQMQHLRARQVQSEDYQRFDFLITMDDANRSNLASMFPQHSQEKVYAMLSFSERNDLDEVPDPYYGSGDGFELVLDLLQDASKGLLNFLRQSEVE